METISGALTAPSNGEQAPEQVRSSNAPVLDQELSEIERSIEGREGCEALLELLRLHHPEYAPAPIIEPAPIQSQPEPAKIIPLPVIIPEPPAGDPIPSLAIIMGEVSDFYRVSELDLRSSRRTANIVKPRQVGMYLCKTLTLRSLPMVGRAFGNKDHTTVLYAVRKIEGLAKTDDRLRDEIDVLKLRIREATFKKMPVVSRINSTGDTRCSSVQTAAI